MCVNVGVMWVLDVSEVSVFLLQDHPGRKFVLVKSRHLVCTGEPHSAPKGLRNNRKSSLVDDVLSEYCCVLQL